MMPDGDEFDEWLDEVNRGLVEDLERQTTPAEIEFEIQAIKLVGETEEVLRREAESTSHGGDSNASEATMNNRRLWLSFFAFFLGGFLAVVGRMVNISLVHDIGWLFVGISLGLLAFYRPRRSQ